MKPTLSALESKLLLKLSWEKKHLVNLPEIVRHLRISREYAYKIASVLCEKKWFERLKSGTYQIIPLEGGPKRVSEMNPYVIGNLLKGPYFFSYATANTHYGFSTQMYNTLFIAVRKRHHPLSLRGVKISFITLSAAKYFGFTEVQIMGEKVKMAEPEKAMLDSLDKPHYAGGIEEVFTVFKRAKGKTDVGKLVEYALRFETIALLQRLGFIIDFLKIHISNKLRQSLLKEAQKGQLIVLASPGRFGRKGEISAEWNIVRNVSPDILRSRS